MIGGLRLAVAIFLILILTLILAPLQLIAKALDLSLAKKIPFWWHGMVLRLLGIRVRVHGTFCNAHPLLLVANHISWADIFVMGSVNELCFIAKDEIRTWPVLSWFAKMQGSVFVDRQRRHHAAVQADTIAARLLGGDIMVLFAEGTTGDGNRILQFKSSLFGAAQFAIKQSHIDMVMVQPVAICYTRLHGVPLGRRYQPHAAWPGDVKLLPHLLNFLLRSAFDVDVVLGKPLQFSALSDRKQIARQAGDQVTSMYGRAINHSL